MGRWLAGSILYQKLGLDEFWSQRLPASRKGTRWDHVLQTLVSYRLIDPGSEWRLHRQWFGAPAGITAPISFHQWTGSQLQKDVLIRNGRFFDYKPTTKARSPFSRWDFSTPSAADSTCPAPQPQAARRNTFGWGVDLNALIGNQFEVQGLRFERGEESQPCYWMNRALSSGAEEWLRGRGGLRCRILTDGAPHCED